MNAQRASTIEQFQKMQPQGKQQGSCECKTGTNLALLHLPSLLPSLCLSCRELVHWPSIRNQ